YLLPLRIGKGDYRLFLRLLRIDLFHRQFEGAFHACHHAPPRKPVYIKGSRSAASVYHRFPAFPKEKMGARVRGEQYTRAAWRRQVFLYSSSAGLPRRRRDNLG